jgi:hypothetical protein
MVYNVGCTCLAYKLALHVADLPADLDRSWLAFSDGPRNCIGMSMAYASVRAALLVSRRAVIVVIIIIIIININITHRRITKSLLFLPLSLLSCHI